jgi:hypothetical protein
LSGGLERKLFAHGGRRVAYSLNCACKLLLCHAKMLGPMSEVIFAIEDNLTAVTGDACVSFHDVYFPSFPATALSIAGEFSGFFASNAMPLQHVD